MNREVKDRINKRKIAYVYLMHRMFEGNPALMLRTLKGPDVKIEDLQDWELDYKEAVFQTIQEEDSKGVTLAQRNGEVPSIKSIKEKALRRIDSIIKAHDDPARLAQVYKILSDYEAADDKKEESVLDAINKAVKPLTPKKKEKTLLERMLQENKITEPGKRGPGRPRKIKPEEAPVEEAPAEQEDEEE